MNRSGPAARHEAPSEVDAELARSILSCPAEVELVVDGYPEAGSDPELGMRDDDGVPTFSCGLGSAIARAAHARRGALVTMTSGLDPDAEDSLTLTGRLATQGTDHCACCGESRLEIRLELDFVLLVRAEAGGRRQVRVPLRAFRSPDLTLNRGYLRRAAEHANDCHHDHLREVVARTSGLPVGDLLGVSLSGLTTHGVELTWIDAAGAHRTQLSFSRPARTCAELGVLLRQELHAGIC